MQNWWWSPSCSYPSVHRKWIVFNPFSDIVVAQEPTGRDLLVGLTT
jgi:hypothetical protein